MSDIYFIMSMDDEAVLADVVNQTATSLRRLRKNIIIVEIAQTIPFFSYIRNVLLHKRQRVGIYREQGIYHSVFVGMPFISRWKFGRALTHTLQVLYLAGWASMKFSGARKIFWFCYPFKLFYLPPSFLVLYDMFDFITSRDVKEAAILEKQKHWLLRRADIVFSISLSLKKLYQSYTAHAITIVPQGCVIPHDTRFRGRASGKKPVIGYIGSVNDRMDYELMENVICRHPEWEFMFIGPQGHEHSVLQKPIEQLFSRILSYAHVIYVDKVDRNQAYAYIRQFDVAMIPYDISQPFNRYCYPMKLFEYFYMGKPVVSTPIEELRRFPQYVTIAQTADQWGDAISGFLKNPWPPAQKKKQRQLALENSWDKKIAMITSCLKTAVV